MIPDEFDERFQVFTVTPPESGLRVDTVLAQQTGLSRSRICALLESGHAFLGDKLLKKSDRTTQEPITLFVPPPEELSAKPQDIALSIVFEDAHLLVVNKPQGMVVHPAAGNPDQTLVNALLYHCHGSLSGIGGVLRPGIVHRIDKDTSGLLVVAKTDSCHAALSELIRTHDFTRRYLAILWGAPREESGQVQYAIGRSKTDRKKMAAYPPNTPGTKNALSEYRILERFRSFSLAEFTLHTGRTHQIRVHAAKLGHPVVGDPVYAAGHDRLGQAGQLLHAAHIGFVHPITHEQLSFDAPIPDYMANFLEKLRENPHETV